MAKQTIRAGKSQSPDDPEESKRFIEDAERIGADDPDALDRALKKIAKKKQELKDKR
jgi:hypothetical protein